MDRTGSFGSQKVGSRLWVYVASLLCAALAVILWIGPWLLRVDLFADDAAHHVFWLYRYADPGLFPGDLSVQYFASGSVAPWGYRAFYAFLAPFVDVLVAAEWMSVVLLCMSLFLAWRLGKSLDSPDPEFMGLLAVLSLVLLLPVADLHPPMGFQRTFALPITLLCLWALTTGRYRWAGISWVSAALFYPVVIPVIGLAASVVFLVDLIRRRAMPRHWMWNLAFGIGAVAIVLASSGTPDGIGPMVTYENARLMPEFGPGGRQQLFGTTWSSYWFGHHRTGLGWSPKVVLALVLASGMALWRKRLGSVPIAAWVLAATGLMLWFIARLVLFDLYLPNRHSRWSLAAFAVVAFSVAAYSALEATAGAGHARNSSLPRGWVRALSFAAPVVVAVALVPTAWATLQQPVNVDLERAHGFLGNLPRDTLVAAHPDLANYVPLRSKRSVLASTETSIAFMTGYYDKVRPRLEASLRAAYATTWQEFDDSLADYGVDVFLTGPDVWTKSTYDAGFDDLARELNQRGQASGFVLQHPPPERVLFKSGETYVIRVGAGGNHAQ